MKLRALRALVVLGAVACTSADVYTVTGAEPYRPDRIAIVGRLCTEDTTGSKFPVKVLVMVDTTQPLALADPDGYRFCGAGSACSPGSIERMVARNRNAQNVSFGFVGITNVARPVVPVQTTFCNPLPCDGQQFFPARDIDVDLVRAALSVPSGSQPDVVNAISQAESFIIADMTRSSAGEVLRTRYIVFMLLGTAPKDNPTPDQLGGRVLALKNFVYSRGALEFRLHTALLYFGERTIDRGTPAYNCHPQTGSTACTCGGGCASDDGNYCGVCCEVENLGAGYYENLYDRGKDAYRSMAFAGDGLFRELTCAPTIDFQIDVATTSVHLMRKDIIAYNLNVRLSTKGPAIDSDGDGLTDAEEEAADPATDPLNWDTDRDGISDRLEFRAFPRQDPTEPRDRPAACGPYDPSFGPIDRDRDLLNDCEEGLLQTNASIPDTDGDGLPDALEFFSGTVPTSAVDRLLDFDGDGIINAQEVIEHTNPRSNDGAWRGAEAYRSTISDLGRRTVAAMEDSPQLRAVSFRSASPNVVGGASLLIWDPGSQELSWCDARQLIPPPWTPVPTPIDNGTGVYTLYCTNPATGEQISIEVFVVVPWLPDATTEVYPLISVSERNCYDVRISNIKLMQTQP
ncbi:MAG: hypothetical protein V3T05_07765, partial [Myxococcota bacterium]